MLNNAKLAQEMLQHASMTVRKITDQSKLALKATILIVELTVAIKHAPLTNTIIMMTMYAIPVQTILQHAT